MASFAGEEEVLLEGFGRTESGSVSDSWRFLPDGLQRYTSGSDAKLCLPLLAPVEGCPGGILMSREWPAVGATGVARAAELRVALDMGAAGGAALVLFSSTNEWVSLALDIGSSGRAEAVLRRRAPDQPEVEEVARQAVAESHMVRLDAGDADDTDAGAGLALRLEFSEDGKNTAALIDTGYCLRLIGRVSGRALPLRAGVACEAAAASPAEAHHAHFAGFRLLAMAPGRAALHGGAPAPAPACPAGQVGAVQTPAQPGPPGLMAAPGEWTLSAELQGDALTQVLRLIGADEDKDGGDAGGAQGHGGAGSGPGAAAGESSGLVTGPGGWTLSADLQGEALREVLSLIGADGAGAPGEQRAGYTVLEPAAPGAGAGAGVGVEARCRREVDELHAFFVRWFTGAVPRTREELARFTDAMHAEMEMVTAGGDRHTLASLAETIDCAHGCMEGSRAGFAIAVRNVRVLRSLGAGAERSHLVSYEEWQTVGAAETARVSTALFREQGGAPNGLAWLHLHETYLAGHAPNAT